MPDTLRNFIDGRFVDARGDEALDLVDPATEEVYGQAPISTAADIDAAYAAAATAFEGWGQTTPAERQLALLKIADAMEERAEEFADLESQDTGKPRDFGCVWINTHIPFVSDMPHGGFKHSGYGKDLSTYGFEDYTRIKHVMSFIG